MNDLPRRRFLPHTPPSWVDPTREVWFITICATPRGQNRLAQPEVGPAILDTVKFRHQREQWFVHLFLLMPDHVHAVLSLPTDSNLRTVIAEWKRWVARTMRIEWQRDFFDHRLRRDASYEQKMEYVRANPVRAGFVNSAEEWPYFCAPEPGCPAV